MRTILIAHRDQAFAEQLAVELRGDGYRVIDCAELGAPCNLAVDSARAHPDVPMLLAWAPYDVPNAATLRAIKAEAPAVHGAAREPAARLRQIHDLLAAGTQVEMLR
jgi:AmiR/NasT family two-component response regulator